jgi:hypothetical protein
MVRHWQAWLAGLLTVCGGYASDLYRSLPVAAAQPPASESSPVGPTQAPQSDWTPAGGRAVVVWLSIDGVRGDYLDHASTPNLERLVAAGASSRQLIPVFPSLTFPSHLSQATGRPVSGHGIPANGFYDGLIGQHYQYPGDSQLLLCEPIWRTAPRQGIRTAVLDWPLSYQQRGNVRTDYYLERYRGDLTDDQRLQQIVEVYRDDPATEPLRLLMGYMSSVDSVGHRYGPLAPQTMAAMQEADRQLGQFLEQMLELFREKMEPQDSFYLLISTDHGMAEVTHYVSLEQLVGQPLASSAFLSTGGNIGHIHLRRVPRGPQRRQAAETLAEQLDSQPYLRAFTRDQLPEHWGYQHPGRVGDVVVVLEPGHTFQRGLPTERVPVAQASGPRGMHGYPAEDCPDMLGLLVLWRYPQPLPSSDWGPVDSLRLHATVADLLGIAPAEMARLPGLSLAPPASTSTVESAP